MPAQYSAYDVADYFLWKAQEENQELLSNMKLQKLVYYAQGLYLAVFEKPLFEDKINAWTYGPVVESLYHTYKAHGASGIPANPHFNPESIDVDTREFLDEVFNAFGQFSAIRLMEITHTDQCWIDAQPTDIQLSNEITCEAMKECLKKYIKNG
jgi:uncharacterized phage-associated protein